MKLSKFHKILIILGSLSLVILITCLAVFLPKNSEKAVPKQNILNYPYQTEKFEKVSLKKEARSQPQKAKKIKEAFIHAWKGYKSNAFGHDNVGPITGVATDGWNEWGITLVDSLDTLILMNLTEYYDEALEKVKYIDYTKSKRSFIVFEIIIRHLGGLISAYDLKGDKILLEQAISLADQLIPVFNTPFGYPIRYYDYKTDPSKEKNRVNSLAEIGSLQLEFHRLSIITGNKTYAEKAQTIIDNIEKMKTKIKGLYPIEINIDTNQAHNDDISFGAYADSFYEYLLKRYILTNHTETQYKRMYEESIKSLHEWNVYQRDKSHGSIVLLTDLHGDGTPKWGMEHLTCFAPGMLMLGSVHLDKPDDYYLGQSLVYSCYQFYNTTTTGLGPEKIAWTPSNEELEQYKKKKPNGLPLSPIASSISKSVDPEQFEKKWNYYRLRPETIESIFYAYKITGNPIYQEWAWRIFEALETYCKTKYGYAEYQDVDKIVSDNSQVVLQSDSMESYFFAETLKYLYLIFEPDALDLNKYVFTTEAHPLKISY